MAKVNIKINGKKIAKEVSDNMVLSGTSSVIFFPLIFILTFTIMLYPVKMIPAYPVIRTQ